VAAGPAGRNFFATVVVVHFSSPSVTDADLEHLKGFTQLKTLSLNGTKVTDAGEKRLQRALPKCGIER
jgi:hypothetical protein